MYRQSFELGESVATYLAAGFEAGEPAVAVATAAHWPLIAERLHRRGWDPDGLEREGTLLRADAAATLDAVSDGPAVSPRLFAEVVGGLIDRAAGAPPRRVRVFGEMVDLLCRRGDQAMADELEKLWNRLAATRTFSLLCGYRIDLFDRDAQLGLLPQVYRAHSDVVAGADADRLEAAVAKALAEILGEADAEQVYSRARRAGDGHDVPGPHRALMWVSAHMPQTAERVLAAARAHYAALQPA